MYWYQQSKKSANLVHQKTVEILSGDEFCAPEE